MPTPFLKRVRNHQLSSPVAISSPCTWTSLRGADSGGQSSLQSPGRRYPRSSANVPFHLESELAGLRVYAQGLEHLGLYESILRALESILRATCPRRTSVAAPGSLMAMCLRKVPEYMLELEKWGKQDAEANRTKSVINASEVAFQVYSDIESLGSVDGWKQLCVVLRAHGIRIVEEAVHEGLFEDEITELSILLCLKYAPHLELGGLIDSFISRPYPDPSGNDDSLFCSNSALWPLEIIRFCDKPLSGVVQGKLAHVLANGSLPPTWILTRNFGSMWSATARHITKKTINDYQGIFDFISITIELLCSQISTRFPKGASDEERRDKEKAQKMLTSGIAALASMVLLGQEGEGPTERVSPDSKTAMLTRRIYHIIQTCINRIQRPRRATRTDLGIYLLRLCAFLAFNATDSASAFASASASTGVEAAWHDISSRNRHEDIARLYDATLALVSTIAYNCSRGMGLTPNDSLSLFCDKLEILNLPGEPLDNLRVDGAFFLAEQTGNLRDLAYAESLRAVSKAGKPRQQVEKQAGTVQAGRPGASYVWDDDIGEWVIANKKPVAAPSLSLRRSTRSSPKRPARASLSLAECIKNFQTSTAGRPPRPRRMSGGSISSWESHSDDDSEEDSEASETESSESEDSGGVSDLDSDLDLGMGPETSPAIPHSPDTPATDISFDSLSASPEQAKPSQRIITSNIYIPLPVRRRSGASLGSKRRASNPAPLRKETQLSDELASSGEEDEEELRPVSKKRRTRSSGWSLLCLKPVRKSVRPVAEESEDELSFV
ncbi:hypothetical protein B0T16DRAFT_412352 [Cercophora newfieldiana]|uniref:Uncharacterized protein n=1 Tax=Cercophora newfieldiana TaxID=92897 RepID=A0AA40CPK6_9PEZI|nr:hypothetical protein B0T16DRAFT_412352 [Cercophora newfieldiana]